MRALPSCAGVLLAVLGVGVSACDGCLNDTDVADDVVAADSAGVGEVTLKPGRFTAGSQDAEPCRDGDEARIEITLTRALAVSTHETTQQAFESSMGYNPSFQRDCPACPVDSVTHHEAAAYCNEASRRAALPQCYRCIGKREQTQCEPSASLTTCTGYRLPTEAEWEYAARAGTKTPTYAGRLSSCMASDEVADRIGWYKASSEGRSHAVGSKEPNRAGLFDMSGNVYEWTADWYQPKLVGGRDPRGPSEGTERVLRGGSWYHNAEHLRSANRHAFRPEKRLSYVGFRCVRTIDSKASAGG